jgi:heat-inducible transcriptional repressor
MISERQERLLQLIIEDYIKTARPIGSKSLCEILDCSSATIRNEMSYLEDIGLLEKTHTSSGRVPSEKGYRYYVDNIMKPCELDKNDVLELETIFNNKSIVLSDAISKSMEIISSITNYTAVVLGSTSRFNKVTKVEVVPIDEENLIAIVITDRGHVEHKNVKLEEKVSVAEVKQTVDLINKLIVGVPINEVSDLLEHEIKPIIGQYVKQHEVLYNAFYNAFTDFSDNNFKMNGTRNILMQPEFNNADKIRDIVSKFEDKEFINSIKEEDNGVNIYIGSENSVDDDLTIIKTKYNINGEEGTLALIGPKRMEYDRAITLLNYIKQNIDN